MEPQHGLGRIREVCALELWIRFRLQSLIWIRIKVRWIHNTVPNRAGFESNYESDSSFFLQMLFWIMILRNRIFFDFSLLNIFGAQSSEPLQKKIQPPACSVCMCSHFFFSSETCLKNAGETSIVLWITAPRE